jgi:hypothetical protein
VTEPWVHDDALANWQFAIALLRARWLGLTGDAAEAEIDRLIKACDAAEAEIERLMKAIRGKQK